MLILNPPLVTFAGVTLADVSAAIIDRAASREAVEWSDLGPHVAFADVPEQRITITLSRRLVVTATDTPRPGDSGELILHFSPTAADSSRRKLTAQCVVLESKHTLPGAPSGDSARPASKDATQTLTLIALSPDGAADPITLTDA